MEENKRPKYFWEKDEFFGLLIAVPLFALFVWMGRYSFVFTVYFYIVLAFFGVLIGVGMYKKKG